MRASTQIGTRTYSSLILAGAVMFLVLPFTMTFNEFLTSIAIRSGIYAFIEAFVAPHIARMAGGILKYVFGFSVMTSGMFLAVQDGNRAIGVSIAWNCIGWQSLLLYAFTISAGLQGSFTKTSKLLCVIVGLEGTVLVNILRIVLVILVSMFWGAMPSALFHEYAGTIIVLLWLVAFWQLSHNYILKPLPDNETESATSQT